MKKFAIAIFILISLEAIGQTTGRIYNYSIVKVTVQENDETTEISNDLVKDKLISLSFTSQFIKIMTTPPLDIKILEAGKTTEDEDGTTYQLKCVDNKNKACRVYINISPDSSNHSIGIQYLDKVIIYFVKLL